MRHCFLLLILFISFIVLLPQSIHAATLSSFSDTITTSRPSASTTLSIDQSTSDESATILDNGSIFLASDAAQLRPDISESFNTQTIASMGAKPPPFPGGAPIGGANPTGWWKFDDGTGTSAVDSSGNSNTGTLQGATDLPTWQNGCVLQRLFVF